MKSKKLEKQFQLKNVYNALLVILGGYFTLFYVLPMILFQESRNDPIFGVYWPVFVFLVFFVVCAKIVLRLTKKLFRVLFS